MVEKNNKYGFIDKQGNLVINFQYDSAYSFSDGIAGVQKNGKWGCIDKHGNLLIDYQYTLYGGYQEGLISVQKNGKMGYVDKEGKTVIDFKYDIAKPFSEGLAHVFIYTDPQNFTGQGRYIDKMGNTMIIEPKGYTTSGIFKDGLVSIYNSNKSGIGYMDKQGKIVIDCLYNSVGEFSEGLAKVKKNDKYGFIDKQGNIIIDFEYDFAESFSDKLARVSKGKKWGYINRNGIYVLESTYNK